MKVTLFVLGLLLVSCAHLPDARNNEISGWLESVDLYDTFASEHDFESFEIAPMPAQWRIYSRLRERPRTPIVEILPKP